MEVIYYFDDDLKFCPVKKYLEHFMANKSDGSKIKERKQRILVTIDAKIQHVKENPNDISASFLSPLHGHNFIEIKTSKNQNTTIRILYTRDNLKIVLLNAFEKPANYDTTKIKKEIEKHYAITDLYVKKYKKNKQNYEKYK